MKDKFRKTMLLSGALAFLFSIILLAFLNVPVYSFSPATETCTSASIICSVIVNLTQGEIILVAGTGFDTGTFNFCISDSASNIWNAVSNTFQMYSYYSGVYMGSEIFYATALTSGNDNITIGTGSGTCTGLPAGQISVIGSFAGNTNTIIGYSNNGVSGTSPILFSISPNETMNTVVLGAGTGDTGCGATTNSFTALTGFTKLGDVYPAFTNLQFGSQYSYSVNGQSLDGRLAYSRNAGCNTAWVYSLVTMNGQLFSPTTTTTITAFNTPSVTDATWIVVTFILLIFWGGASTLLIEMKRTKNILFVSLFTLVIGSIAGVLAGFNGGGIISFAIPVFYGIPLFLYFMRNRGNDSST